MRSPRAARVLVYGLLADQMPAIAFGEAASRGFALITQILTSSRQGHPTATALPRRTDVMWHGLRVSLVRLGHRALTGRWRRPFIVIGKMVALSTKRSELPDISTHGVSVGDQGTPSGGRITEEAS
jgi:hypothetical protein